MVFHDSLNLHSFFLSCRDAGLPGRTRCQIRESQKGLVPDSGIFWSARCQIRERLVPKSGVLKALGARIGRSGARFGDAVPDSGGAEPNLGIYFCGVLDLGFFSSCDARFGHFTSCGARFGNMFTVWCQIWVFRQPVVPDLGNCFLCVVRFGHLFTVGCQGLGIESRSEVQDRIKRNRL